MKNQWIIIVFLLLSNRSYSQDTKYVIFEKRAYLDSVKKGSFNLYYNQVDLADSKDKQASLTVYNLYFAKSSDFNTYVLYREEFKEAKTDYQKFKNDILITLTPLKPLDTILKTKKLKEADLEALQIITPDQLAQEAVKNIYNLYANTEFLTGDQERSVVKTLKYGLILKDKNSYILIEEPVLTEFYILYAASWFFPNQCKYATLNIRSSDLENSKFTENDIGVLYNKLKNNNSTSLIESLIEQLNNRIYFSGVDTGKVAGVVYNYWTFPRWRDFNFSLEKEHWVQECQALENFSL